MIILPRQAQDKHSNVGKALKKEYRFLAFCRALHPTTPGGSRCEKTSPFLRERCRVLMTNEPSFAKTGSGQKKHLWMIATQKREGRFLCVPHAGRCAQVRGGG
eukprot:COSAG06_NODE_46499_length_346_cov_0.967611_1_plen_102_part_10